MPTRLKKVRPILDSIFLFANLADHQKDQLVQFTALRRFEKGEMLFLEGQAADTLYAFVSGRVKVYRLSVQGDEHIVHIVDKTGELIAEAAIFGELNYPASCEACLPSTVLTIPRQPFLNFVQNNPRVSLRLLEAYSKRLREMVTIIESLAFGDVKSRLARYILKNCSCNNGTHKCQWTISKKDLAALLGTIPETLSRTLNFYKTRGILREVDGGVEVENCERLKAFV